MMRWTTTLLTMPRRLLDAAANIARLFHRHPLTRARPLAAWSRFMMWQIRSRRRTEIVVPWIAGQRLVVRNGMTGATGNIYTGLHEFTDMMFVLHYLRAGDLFLDIGANIGSYTVLASGVRGAVTWAFEPDPDTLRHLRRNIAENHLADLVTVHGRALGAQNGEVAFTVGLDTVNRVATELESNVRLVPLSRLDDIGGASGAALIKMDVEGFEDAVIEGARAVLASKTLRALLVETTSPAIETTLRHHGFEQWHYDAFARRLQPEPSVWGSANTLFVRDAAAVQARLAAAPAIEVLGRHI